MEAARHLSLAFDPETGELREPNTCPGCVAKERELERKTFALDELQRKQQNWASELGKVRAMLVRQRKSEVRAEWISEVLECWREKCMPKATIAIGGKRWEKVRARLEDELDRGKPWTVEELKLVPEGALLDPWLNGSDPKSKGYLDAETLYRDPEMVDKLVKLAQGFRTEHGCYPSSIPERVLRDFHFEPLLAKCDFCQHLRLEHSKGDPARDGAQACLVHGCDCLDGSWYDAQVGRWIEEHR